jgi:undecaprenyl-diphosphatase
MLTAFFVVGLVFIILEYVLKNDKVALTKEVPNMTLKEALIIGVVQSLAVLPGVSRAGSVIVGMIFLKYKRTDAARFSFLLSIPTIFAASFLELFKMRDTLMSNSNNLMLLIVGCVVAFISSYIVVKWFINYLKNHSLEIFGWYRVLLVIIILLFIYFRVI